MDLKEFRQKEKEDSNLFWRLSEGERQNLLDEAMDESDRLWNAILRSPYDLDCCNSCKKLTIALPDGLPVCNDCVKHEEESEEVKDEQ